ncbi:MAG TPA: cytochrome c [Pseudolabrys sp.]|nr:cytochrome c [Pseudolabrys sp.]
MKLERYFNDVRVRSFVLTGAPLSERYTMKVLAIVSVLLAVAAGDAAAQTQDPVRRGRALVNEFCSDCHAIGKSGKSPHESAPPFRTLGRSFDLDQFPRRLERGISSGHPDMPEFKFGLDDAQAVRAYLRTIQE